MYLSGLVLLTITVIAQRCITISCHFYSLFFSFLFLFSFLVLFIVYFIFLYLLFFQSLLITCKYVDYVCDSIKHIKKKKKKKKIWWHSRAERILSKNKIHAELNLEHCKIHLSPDMSPDGEFYTCTYSPRICRDATSMYVFLFQSPIFAILHPPWMPMFTMNNKFNSNPAVCKAKGCMRSECHNVGTLYFNFFCLFIYLFSNLKGRFSSGLEGASRINKFAHDLTGKQPCIIIKTK